MYCLLIPSGEFVRISPISCGICHIVVIPLWEPITNLLAGFQWPLKHLQEGCSQVHIVGGVVALGGVVAYWEAWWLSGSAPDFCPAVPSSHPASPQPTVDCQSYCGLPPGMALGCGLTSVRGDRGENYEKWTAGSAKTYQKKNISYISESVNWNSIIDFTDF